MFGGGKIDLKSAPEHGRSTPLALPGIENGSSFPDTVCSAIIAADDGSHLENLGLLLEQVER